MKKITIEGIDENRIMLHEGVYHVIVSVCSYCDKILNASGSGIETHEQLKEATGSLEMIQTSLGIKLLTVIGSHGICEPCLEKLEDDPNNFNDAA